jgi:hypothetical protein
VFLNDRKFNAKRAGCYSSTTKQFSNIGNQRIDFILRSINDENDYVSSEEKSGRKGVKADLQKGKIVQVAMLKLWSNKLKATEVMKHLEAITCQWEGLKFVIFATKCVSDKYLVTYRRGSFCMPKDESHCASFATLLAAMLSLKRLVFLNYSKLNAVLEAKYRHQFEMMTFETEDENEFLFLSESTEEIEAREEKDEELEKESLEELNGIKLKEDIITSDDWEDYH